MDHKKPLEYVERIEKIELALTQLNASRSLVQVERQLEVTAKGNCVLLRDRAHPASMYYNRVKGFGPTDVSALEEILSHYNDGAPCFDLTPDRMTEEVARALSEKGYMPAEQLVFMRTDPAKGMGRTAEFQIEQVTEENAEEFIRWIALSNEGMELTDEMIARTKAYFYSSNFKNYMLTIDGNPAAMGSLFWQGNEGYIANDYTFPSYRGRGCQSALLRHRLSDAVQLGIETVYTDVEFGSVSHSNMERLGFQTVYLATYWIHR